MNIVIMGKPGCGKGTQAQLLEKQMQFTAISTGNLIRQEMERKTPLGIAIKNDMDAGLYLDDERVFSLLNPYLQNDHNLVFDGFPRTLPQAQRLAAQKEIDIVFNIVVPDGVLKSRLEKRWMVSIDEVQHSFSSKEKAENFQQNCGGKLFQRPEDHPLIIQKRLTIYAQKTAPILAYYESQQKVISIDGTKSIGEIHQIIANHILEKA